MPAKNLEYPFQAPVISCHSVVGENTEDFSVTLDSNSVDIPRLLKMYSSSWDLDVAVHDQVAYAFTLHYASLPGPRIHPKVAVGILNRSITARGLLGTSKKKVLGAVGVSYLVVAGKVTHAMFATSVPCVSNNLKKENWRKQRIDKARAIGLGVQERFSSQLKASVHHSNVLGNCQEELSLLGLHEALLRLNTTDKKKASIHSYTEGTKIGSQLAKPACRKCQFVLQNAALKYGVSIIDDADDKRILPPVLSPGPFILNPASTCRTVKYAVF
jgi:hypothetical protein